MSLSTAALIVGPILAMDAAVSRAIHSAVKPFFPAFILLLLEISADFRFSFPVSLSLLLSPPLRPFLIPFLLGLLFDLIFVGIVKLIFRRARPSYNHPSMSAAVSADHYSFPSGHASRVFFVAASVHFFSAAAEASMVGPSYSCLDGWVRDHRDGDVKREVVVAVWIWATVTAISRIFLGRHYVLDVAAGACLGILEALFALRFLRFEQIFGIEPAACTAFSAGNSVDLTKKQRQWQVGVGLRSQNSIDMTFSSESLLHLSGRELNGSVWSSLCYHI